MVESARARRRAAAAPRRPGGRGRRGGHRSRHPAPAPAALPRAALALALLLAALGVALAAPAPARAADKPTLTLSKSQAGTGGSVTVSGKGWRPDTLLMMLVCGQAAPAVGVPGGTNSCANSRGRAVTTDGDGAFRKRLPVAEPPQACPCVVHVATVTGRKTAVDAAFKVAGHPVRPLPARQDGGGRLSVLTDTRLDGSGSLLTWFGSPPTRRLVFTVGNVGSTPVRNPVFQVGTSHGVFAPQWEEQQWRGTIAPGRKAQIELSVELPAGAHGDYLVSLRYADRVLAEQPWGVGRPWGVTLFWVLLCVVVPAAVFRVGMVLVDRLRPDRGRRPPGRHRTSRVGEFTVRLPRLRLPQSAVTAERETAAPAATTTTLPWFSPDADPGAPAGQLSAPSDNGPTTKGES
ncbi:hypothetical protein [Streptomyces flavofungini]|uniref:hypothetical protein n=1 Tax=Streptomyces flavofungini TaxID=68200 RepID=UPI0019A5B2A7|nr:hypothetical protein [Streptomyces flavofungini]GHC62544.1 hypothetical protein GCM10010349_33010 [Streptomyces flavofungini]